MNKLKISVIIIAAVVIVGMIVIVMPFKAGSNAVIQLSVTVQTTPGDAKIHTPEELANMDNSTTILDNSTLDKIPVLKDAIDQAYNRFEPPPLHGIHTFTTQITPDDANAIMALAGNKVTQLPETQSSDSNFGVNYTDNSSDMEFKLDNFYYSVVIEQLAPTQ
jgi:hypothetical protein